MQDSSTDAALADIAAEAAALPEEPKPAATLENVSRLGLEVLDIDARIAKNEERIAELKARRNKIVGTELPDIFDTLQMSRTTIAGREFVVENYYHANIAADWEPSRRETAFDWLEAHEAGSIIANQVVASFPKGHEEESRRLETYIRKNYQMASVSRERGVPWNRLTSWLREVFESEDEKKVLPPLDVFGATVGRVVKIKNPRKTKGT